MNFLQFKSLISSFSANRIDLNKIINLVGKTNIAMRQVARDTLPLTLLKNKDSNRNVLRRVDNDTFLCIPEDVVDDDSNLEMDTHLLDAVGLFVLAGIETARAPSYMRMYWNIVESHENGLINDDLSMKFNVKGDMVNDVPEIIVDRDNYNDYIEDKSNELKAEVVVGEFNG